MKNLKSLAVLSTAALMVLGMSSVAFAATNDQGWVQNGSEWQYLDKNGDAVTNDWKRSGDYWFYLDSDGNMATDALIEDDDNYYYVDANGVMVTNTWKAVADDDWDGSDEADYAWYYFGTDGKAYKSKDDLDTSEIKTINGLKYAFDDEGHMLYGWVSKTNAEMVNKDDDSEDWKNEDTLYYFNGWNDGHMSQGWEQINVYDSTAEDGDGSNEDYWFYFDTNGKKTKDKKKTINGKTYLFDVDGHMKTEWAGVTASDSDLATSSDIAFTDGDGSQRKSHWVWAIPDEDMDKDDHDDDEYSWWWTDASGKIVKNTRKKINGKYYIFDAEGRMQYGLLVADDAGKHFVTKSYDADDDFTDRDAEDFEKLSLDGVYFYSDDEVKDGSRKTGYQTVEFGDGAAQMYFTKSGEGKTEYNTKIDKYTASGVVLKADSDDGKYAGVKTNGAYDDFTLFDGLTYGSAIDANANVYLIGTTGALQKNKTNLKDSNLDYYYFTDKNGQVIYASDKKLEKKSDGAIWIDTNGNGTEDAGEHWKVDDDD